MSRLRLARLLPAAAALLTAGYLADVLPAQQPGPVDKTEAPKAAPASRWEVGPADTPEEASARDVDQRLIEEVKANSQLMANLTYLSDDIGARLTGSANLKRANEWAAEKMKAYGLENVRLEPWTIPAGWERGVATMRLLDPDNGRVITCAAAGWSPSTAGAVEGDVVIFRAERAADLAQYKGKLKNAIVLRRPPTAVRPISDSSYSPPGGGPVGPGGPGGPGGRRLGGGERQGRANPDNPPAANPPAQPPATPPATTPPAATPPGQPPANPPAGEQPRQPERGPFERGSAFTREVSEFLRAEGAAVVLMDAGKPHGLLNMSGGWRNTERAGAAEPLPSLYVTHDHYALLWRLASRPAPAKTRAVVEVTNKVISGPITCYNTVGEIRGSEKPDEFVVCGAHIDSWDLGQGTTDNGTGTCVVLEAARALVKSGVKPRRTIRFALFSGEEQGLHGSRAYVQAHKDEMPKTSMCIVHDTGTGKVVSIGTQGREPIKPIFEKELTSLKALGVNEITLRRMGGSDHNSFDTTGVPGLMFSQDPAEYRFTHHSQSDTLDKARPADLIQGAQVMSITALRVANLPNLLPRERTLSRGEGR